MSSAITAQPNPTVPYWLCHLYNVLYIYTTCQPVSRQHDMEHRKHQLSHCKLTTCQPVSKQHDMEHRKHMSARIQTTQQRKHQLSHCKLKHIAKLIQHQHML